MKRFPLILLIGSLALIMTACQLAGPGAKEFGLAGTWMAKFGTKHKDGKIVHNKGEVTFSGNSYKYSWYEKLVSKDGSVIYDWSETSRETGSVSFKPEYMIWTANAYGTAEYNTGTRQWSPVNMGDSASKYTIYYTLEGDTLTTKEDYNLDGDFDDTFGAPETIVYTRKK